MTRKILLYRNITKEVVHVWFNGNDFAVPEWTESIYIDRFGDMWAVEGVVNWFGRIHPRLITQRKIMIAQIDRSEQKRYKNASVSMEALTGKK